MKTLAKFLIMLLCFFAYSINVSANERISFTGQDTNLIGFCIIATNGQEFIVDWGDGSAVEMQTCENDEWLCTEHTYADYGDYTVTITGVTDDCLFRVLNCSENQLINLDLSASTGLESLSCCCNRLTDLDLSTNMALDHLNCFYNQLTNINLSTNTALQTLYCFNNQLTVLDLSASTTLRWLECHDNLLTVLDLSSTKLVFLECSNNLLTDLDLSASTTLLEVYCADNQLTDLYLGESKGLEFLSCPNNQLTVLDLSANTELFALNCSSNQLTSLNLSANTKLFGLACNDNHLQLSDLYNISEMTHTYNNRLGPQTLDDQTVAAGNPINFSEQKEFGGIATVFMVEKGGLPAPQSDYTVVDGMITFHHTGDYIVTMTNAAIIFSQPDYPAQVIAGFNVENAGIADATQEALRIKIYPNPTTGKIQVTGDGLRVTGIEIFDMLGKKQYFDYAQYPKTESNLDISNLPAGIYFVRIQTKQGMITKKIVKR